MARLPQISGPRLMRALERAGWQAARQSGSHVQMVHPERAGRVTVPIHGSTVIPPKTLRAIVTQAGMTIDELRRIL